jgi:hypothetical protein
MVQLEGVSIAKPAPPETYLGVAESMIAGVNVLAKHGIGGLALPLVAAHTLECALKAYLSRDGQDSRLKQPALRHHIEELWKLARTEGLPIGDVPDWAANLSRIHDKPYYLRYSTGIHGIVTPAPEPMATELAAIIGTVRQGIHDYRKSLE